MNCSQDSLEHIYKQSLEQNIIEEIAGERAIDYRLAAEIYYKSKLAHQISAGTYGIQPLDHHDHDVLA